MFIVPTSLIRNFLESSIFIPNIPFERTDTKTPYLGSWICIGDEVPHLISNEKALLTYQTSAVNGERPPNGRFTILFKTGILAVSRVCLPLWKTSSAFPP